MHKQHHALRNPTAFGGTAVHPLEGILQITIPANLLAWVLPIRYDLQQLLLFLIFALPAVGGHDGGYLDFVSHYKHHETWHRGPHHYKNYGLMHSGMDRLLGTWFTDQASYDKEVNAWKNEAKNARLKAT
jgi:sterol desaturase/sphingolipid hydroxylase (fatty acid hydroxylase superfamily)